MSTVMQPGQVTVTAKRSPYLQPAFLWAAGLLAIAAVALNSQVINNRLHFKKLPVPPARPLADIPLDFGNWIQVSRDEPLDPDTAEVLDTQDYIFRDYLNMSSHNGECAADLIQALHMDDNNAQHLHDQYMADDPPARRQMIRAELEDRGKTVEQRRRALAIVEQHFPDAVVNMSVTYFTGMVDTVAHIPDRCYIADGFEPTDYIFPTWKLADGRDLQVRFINFEDQSGESRISRSVAYFFHVNGHYESDPLRVRFSLQNLLQKYGYYAKVELMTLDSQQDRSAQTMTNFLSDGLTEVEKSFPDWAKLTGSSGG